MKTLKTICTLLLISTGIFAQVKVNSDVNVGIGTANPQYKLDVAGTTQTENLLIKKPNNINNWNNLWQSGFYDAYDAANSPESSQWFWGINMGHISNNPNYRYGGQIAIRYGNNTPTMYFRSINVDGEGTWAKVLHNTGLQEISGKLKVTRTGDATYASHVRGIEAISPVVNSLYMYGVYGQATSSQAVNGGRAFGVYGLAGNSSSGYNCGVAGILHGEQNGAAIYGTATSVTPNVVSGRYAGYFDGNVKVTGTLNGLPLSSSDIRYKQNIVELTNKETSILDNLLKLKPIEYNFKQQYPETKSDTATTKQGLYDEKSQIFLKKHYGLIAQELQKIYPDLVYEEDNGYLAVNYVEIIPLLIQSIQELHKEIVVLKNASGTIGKRKAEANNLEDDNFNFIENIALPALYQNTPNPFNQTTQIGFYIPENVQIANLYIYDLNGIQQKHISIATRNKSFVTLQASSLGAGIYFYTLICDGNPVDTKQMILTK